MYNRSRIFKTLLYLLAGIAVFVLLSYIFSNILVYFIVSVVLTTLLRPLVNYVSQLHFFSIRVPRIIAVLLAFALLVFVFGVLVVLFIPLISDQVELISSLEYDAVYDQITNPLSRVESFLLERELVTDRSPGFLVVELKNSIDNFFATLDVTTLLNNIVSFAGGLSIGLLAVIFITFFLLYEKGMIRRGIISLIPNAYFEMTIAAMYKMEQRLSNYLLGLLFQAFSIFSIASLGLSIFEVDYALTIALFAAVANLIPYAGPLLGSLFGLIVGVSTNQDLITSSDYGWMVAKIIAVFSTVQLIDNLVLQPLIFSKSVKAHPLEIFVVIFAGATLAGIPGMIVAIPVYTVLRVMSLELYKGVKAYRIFRTNTLS